MAKKPRPRTLAIKASLSMQRPPETFLLILHKLAIALRSNYIRTLSLWST
ncbi:hypothetical protein CCACVL1_13144 [Corchorus capsularis]|uniref:Uncharacterized protein n=1 Tax=Corchorus capsularis TaxID=210143 RepID=A0A1R3IC07_COCAP|nr:hypothetical protein CCACVL1_13144 [Corchorus capsularis]